MPTGDISPWDLADDSIAGGVLKDMDKSLALYDTLTKSVMPNIPDAALDVTNVVDASTRAGLFQPNFGLAADIFENIPGINKASDWLGKQDMTGPLWQTALGLTRYGAKPLYESLTRQEFDYTPYSRPKFRNPYGGY